MAIAMLASLQASEKGTKSDKRPPVPGRKKVLCAQRETEPPPGFEANNRFEAVKKHDDAVVSKDKVDGKTSKTSFEDTGGKVDEVEQDKPSHQDIIVGLKTKSRTSLAGSLSNKRSHGDAATASDTSNMGTKTGSPPLPVTMPPGCAKTHQANSQPRTEKVKSEVGGALSSKAFPPLTSGKNATGPSMSLSSSSKSIVGSRIFENILQALDNDKAKFKEFQTLSGWFRSGVVTRAEYDTQCEELFGPRWGEVGPLIARVMPRGEKKDELLALFATRDGSEKQKASKRNKVKKPPNAWIGGDGSGGGEERASGNGGNQRLFVSEEDYPSLSVASKLPQPKSSSNNAWKVPVS